MAFRFGILGTGNIATQFARGMATSQRCTISAVGSRSPASAKAFADQYAPGAKACSYDDVLASPEVDGVYVSFPNDMHKDWTIKALRSGKHVLCEKPLAMNAAEAEEMFAEASKAGKLLVEAFMYVSHPLTKAYMKTVKAGTLGTLRHIRSSFCFRTTKVEGNYRFTPAQGGGALYDIGCYCISFSRMVAGAEPIHVSAEAVLHPTGVDEQVSAVLRFPGDLTATFNAGMSLQADNTATISGTEGYLEVPVPWKPGRPDARFVIARSTPPLMDGGKPALPPREEFDVPTAKDLYALEADDFAAAVAREIPPAVTAENSLGNMRVIDQIRASWRVS